jgi:metallo-beta-lactamase family protein
MMKIHFHGAAQTVTGSMHLLQVNNHRLLLDCGLFQGRREETYRRNRSFPFDPARIDAMILSHAHIDHSGNLPHLVKAGYRGPIYCTEATAHLTNIMLLDSGHIQESDAIFVNKRRAERGEPPIEPLYTQEDAALVAMLFDTRRYNEVFEVIPGVVASLIDAGHILGSAAVSLDVDEKGRRTRLWFSGDIGRRGLPLLRDPVLPQDADYMIMEATYGDKPHRNPEVAYEELRSVLNRTIERGGKVIIPAFAVGRTQELVYDFQRMFTNKEVPRVPVIVDSPLAVNASQIFRQHLDCYDQETMEFVRENRHQALLGFDLLTYTRSVEESKALNGRKDPMIIISASGMAETGRILHHLRNNIGDKKNTVLIVSWQSPYTLGRRLADREKQVKIFGEVYEVRAEVSTIGGLSAHAGQNFLIDYALAVRDTVREIFLVHAEEKPAGILAQHLKDKGLPTVHYPNLHDQFELGAITN